MIVAIATTAPIIPAYLCNKKREEFFDKAVEAGRRGNAEELDFFFDKSRDYRRCRDVILTISAAAFLFNFFDSLMNVTQPETTIETVPYRLIRLVPKLNRDKAMLHMIFRIK